MRRHPATKVEQSACKEIMNRLPVILCVLGGPSGRLLAAESKSKPDIVFILRDDYGYCDLSCCGAKLVQTPVPGRLAGVIFPSPNAASYP
jgi:hypothetical protein